jgi:hypothetical protein
MQRTASGWRARYPGTRCCVSCQRTLPVNDRQARRLCWLQAWATCELADPVDVIAGNRFGQQLMFAISSPKNSYGSACRPPPSAVAADETIATTGDPRRITDFFGLTITTAEHYATVLDHSGLDRQQTEQAATPQRPPEPQASSPGSPVAVGLCLPADTIGQ